jgi:peptidoglycan/xylan/chitin deacetylase (PgdA/CDA1 family)
MRFLAVQKITVIPLARLSDYLHGRGDVPERAAVITIDDGYKSAWEKAWPILAKYHYPVTLFVYPQFISRHKSALTWEELREMNRAGAEIGSHSLTHPLLTNPPKAMNLNDYLFWLDTELVRSKGIIEGKLGHRIRFLAYPYGGYDQRVVERTRRAGYDAAVTCDDGNVDIRTDAFHLNRRLVLRGVGAREFSRYFHESALPVGDLNPQDGERVRRHLDKISGRIINWQEYDPKSAEMIVDKLGRRPFHIFPDKITGSFELSMPAKARSGYYFVSLTARDHYTTNHQTAAIRRASWLFIYRNTSRK